MIFLQGLEDKVVPPNQAESMVGALRQKGLPVAYLTFEGEGHGFRGRSRSRRPCSPSMPSSAKFSASSRRKMLPPLAIENLPAA